MAQRPIQPTPEGPTSVPTVTAPAPPPANVQSRFLGRLSFQDGYPTPETTQTLYDALDYQRAVQVVLRNVAAHGIHCFRLGLARDLGVDAANVMAIVRADAHSLMLTPNSETLYGIAFLRLDTDGPTVVEAPPGVLGFVDDMWMRPVEDIGPGGPDAGKGGEYSTYRRGTTGQCLTAGVSRFRPVRMAIGWLCARSSARPVTRRPLTSC